MSYVVLDGSISTRSSNVTLLLGPFKIVFFPGGGIFAGYLISRGIINFNVDLGHPVADFLTVFEQYLTADAHAHLCW